MLQCVQCQEKTCTPWISGVTSAQTHFNIVLPWSSNDTDVVFGTPNIMLSVSELDFNLFYVFSTFHVMTVFHISLLKSFNYLFWFESCALVTSLLTCCPSAWKEKREVFIQTLQICFLVFVNIWPCTLHRFNKVKIWGRVHFSTAVLLVEVKPFSLHVCPFLWRLVAFYFKIENIALVALQWHSLNID